MHKVQKILLKRLLVQNKQRYSTMTQGYSYEDNVVFHLRQLANKGYLQKQSNRYLITTKGVKEITKYDLPQLEDTGFKTFFIGFLCNYKNHYLVKEHPQAKKNFYNLPSGKPRFGESIEDSLIRAFHQNTDLKLKQKDFQYLSLHLKTIKTQKGEILFDDAFAVYQVSINGRQKMEMKLQSQILWKTEDEIKKLTNRWPEIDKLIIEKDHTPYSCYKFTSDYIL